MLRTHLEHQKMTFYQFSLAKNSAKFSASKMENSAHPFGTSANRSEAHGLKRFNFIVPQALIQQLYY